MKMRTMQIVVTLIAVARVAGEAGMKREEYVPYEATADEIVLTNVDKIVAYERAFQQPENGIFKKRLDEILSMAEEEESRIRHMVAKGMVRTNVWSGMYSGSVIVGSQKSRFRFIFKSSSMDIQQVDRIVFEDRMYGKRKPSECYTFTFHDQTDYVSSFTCGEGTDKVVLNFYPKNRLASCGLTIGDEYYRAQWDESGKLVSETKRKIEK